MVTKGGPLNPGPGDYDKQWTSGETWQRIVGNKSILRHQDPTTSHIVRNLVSGQFTYVRINGVVLTKEELDKLNRVK